MTFHHKKQHTVITSFLVGLLIFVGSGFAGLPKIVEAGVTGQPVVITSDLSQTGTQTLVENTSTAISTGVTAAGTTDLVLKETVLDPLFYAAARVFLRQMVTEMVRWINSGFNGAPMFVSDITGFLNNVADATIGDFIYNDPALSFLCAPFQMDVMFALEVQYYEGQAESYEPQCTLSDVTDNVEGFLSGSFEEGGWQSWFEIITVPENTPTGAYLSAKSELYARIINAQGAEIARLDFGDGFFSMEICDIDEYESGSVPNCTIGTPGSVIAGQINNALGAGQDELIAADEVNEIFNALFAQLAKQAISGVNGMLGLGGNEEYVYQDLVTTDHDGANGGSSYLDDVINEDEEIIESTLDSLGVNSPIHLALEAEFEYLELQYEVLGRVEAAEVEYEADEQTLLNKGCPIETDFPDELSDALIDAEFAIANSPATIVSLQDMILDFDNATTIEEQLSILDQYYDLYNSGLIRQSTDNLSLQLFIELDIVNIVEDLEEETQQEINQCDDDD